MRDLQDKTELDVRFTRSENNSSDIMTKNTTKDINEHIQQLEKAIYHSGRWMLNRIPELLQT
jgi:hypothetical protein